MLQINKKNQPYFYFAILNRWAEEKVLNGDILH